MFIQRLILQLTTFLNVFFFFKKKRKLKYYKCHVAKCKHIKEIIQAKKKKKEIYTTFPLLQMYSINPNIYKIWSLLQSCKANVANKKGKLSIVQPENLNHHTLLAT